MALSGELERLRALARASRTLAASRDLDELLVSVLAAAREAVGAERGTVFVCEPEKREIFSRVASGRPGETLEIRLPYGQGLAGRTAGSGEAIRVDDVTSSPGFDPETDRRTGFVTKNVLCLPLRTPDGAIAGVLQLLNKDGGFTAEDEEFLPLMGTLAAQALANARAREVAEAQRALARELALAAEIQRALLPRELPCAPGVSLAARCLPSAAVGGDYFDAVTLPGGRWLLCLADVSGKGIPAALVVSSLQAALHSALALEFDLARFAAGFNAMLHGRLEGKRYLTGVLLEFDPRSGEGRLLNCGHPPPLVVGPAGGRRLAAKGMPVGLLPELKPAARPFALAPGETLLAYSDGVSDATGGDGEPLGVAGVERLLAASVAPAAGATLDRLFAALADALKEPGRDDCTAMVVSVSSES